MKSYKHLTIYEREFIAIEHGKGKSSRQIGKMLDRHHSTIARELAKNKKRNPSKYSPHQAQNHYMFIRKLKCRPQTKLEKHEGLKELINTYITVFSWSPEQISNRLKLENVCSIHTNTIYRYIYQGKLENLKYWGQAEVKKSLRRKGRKKNKKVTQRHNFEVQNHLKDRPEIATNRLELGHWEADTVLGKQNESCLITMVDRKSRLTRIIKIPLKNSEYVKIALNNYFKDELHLKSITPDRGSEFAQHKLINEYLGVPFYFPDAGRPQDRGTNENTNGLIREFIPKRKSMENITDEMIKEIEEKLNNRPRKCLNWLTPNEVYYNKRTTNFY